MRIQVRIRKKKAHLGDFVHGMDDVVRWPGFSISENIYLLGNSHTTAFKVYTEWFDKILSSW